MQLSALWRYPLKSAAGESLEQAAVEAQGLVGDRRWMVVDPQGQFLTQRRHRRMALLQPQLLEEGGLRLCFPEAPPLDIAPPRGDEGVFEVQVWKDSGLAVDAGDAAADWLSACLNTECRLVCADARFVRKTTPRYDPSPSALHFADGFPFLLLSQSAVDALNARLEAGQVDVRRFRPNLVIADCPAHAEDQWRRLRIGALEFELLKACDRCAIPGIDPDTAQATPWPLPELARYRRNEEGRIVFGQNAVLRSSAGSLAVGDPVEVLD